MMKRLCRVLLLLALALTLASCGKAGGSGTSSGAAEKTSVPASQGAASGNEGTEQADTKASDSGKTEAAMIPGKLNFIDLDDREASVLKGISFSGNRSGSKDFNEKAAATEGIRCIFELNEYVAGIPDTDVTSGISVYVLKHREDQTSYEKERFSDETAGFVYRYEMEQNEGDDWGSFYLNPEECEAGYYDFVFVYKDKAVATMLTRFYAQGELEEKTDKELEEIMKGLIK